MDLLIHTNGQTTTREVKTQLRDLDYRADQVDVSRFMASIAMSDVDNKYEFAFVNSDYKTYKFTQDFIDNNPKFAPAPIVDGATVTGSPVFTVKNSAGQTLLAVTDTNSTVKQNAPSQPFTTKQTSLTSPTLTATKPVVLSKPVIPSNLRDPLFIFYTEAHVRKSGTDENSWVVSHKDGNTETQIYDKSLTSDLARSRYATIMHYKIQDVRARRFKNY